MSLIQVDPSTGEIITAAPEGRNRQPGDLVYNGISPKGLSLPLDLTENEWASVGHYLRRLESGLQFALGDWLNYGSRRFGEKYTQALEDTSYDYQTLRNYAWVAEHVDLSRRRDNLSWGHHAEVAALPPVQQDELLNWCLTPTTVDKPAESVAALRGKLRVMRQKAIAANLPVAVANVVYADPPWQYDNFGPAIHGAADNHYATMALEDILALPKQLEIQIANDAVLFLWVTNQFVAEALQVIEAWGFEYKTNMVWVKTDLDRPGAGWYVRGRHELLYIATKGSFTPLNPNLAPPVGSVIEAALSEHSAKPDEVYSIIEKLYPGCHYLELFARRRRDGWQSWGAGLD
ncbi:MAG TPA: MT-A70 family methyltransferase [Terriglobales bacterium]|nr:MT-A70 family methyltransferase [Terriglobales bacterium]